VNLLDQARRASEAFQLPGVITYIQAHEEGLIHETFVVSTSSHGNAERFILQRINQQVFADPELLMQNMECVVSHLQQKAIQSGRDPQREVMSLIRTNAGEAWHESAGQAWRMVRYTEGTEIIHRAPSIEQASEIGKAFGAFLDDLSDFPLESLQTALPGYRDTECSLASLWEAAKEDPLDRAVDAGEEISFIESRVDDAMRLQDLQRGGEIPLRVVHGDTKLNNVLLDAETGSGVCVIDLDTVMPGLLLHDIGDCVREALAGNLQHQASLAAHDRQVFEAIIAGFLSKLSTPPVALESANILAGVKSITLELGARFLADYLSGDAYFKTAFSEENLHRAREQIHLLAVIERGEGELQSIVQRCASGF